MTHLSLHQPLHDETTWTSAGSRSQKGNDWDVKFRNEIFAYAT